MLGSMTFPEIKDTTINVNRQKRQLVEQAIAAAASGDWPTAADINRRILEFGPESEGENRLRKAPWGEGDPAAARGEYPGAAAPASKAPVGIFVEETGKTGSAFLVDLAHPRQLAHVNPGDAVELVPDGNRLVAHSNGVTVGVVEPRVAARLLKLIADGNRYSAGGTSPGDKDVRVIIREVFQDP